MYRLLKLSGASLRNCSPLSLRNIYENTDIKINERTCLLCKNLDTQSRSKFFARKSSSATNTFLSEIKRSKRKKKVTKKYSDILVVSDGASTLQKANIKILTSNDLKLLANTELNLGELYKLKDIQKSVRGEHTYNNLTAVDNLNSSKTIFNEPPVIVTYNVSTSTSIEPQESLEELNEAHSEVDLENIPIVNSLQPEVPEPVIEAEVEDCDIDLPATKESKLKPKIVVKPQDPRIQQHRDLITKRTLAAYIEICNHQKNPQRGLSAINFHRSRLRHRQSYYTALTSKNIYNSLLKGFAHKGDFDKLQEVLGIMAEDNVDKNEVSYAAIFECLGRINIDNNHLKDIRIFVKELHSKQLTFDDVMNKNKFLNDERDMVLKAIHSTSPSYTPNYWKPKVQYDNHLVNSLNDKAQLKYQLEPWTPNGGMFTPETLSDGVKKQMKMELDGYVQIKSIEPKPNPTEEVKYYRKSLENHYKLWEESALKAFQRDLAAVTAKKNPLNIEPYLRCIPMKDFISIIVEEAKKIAQGSESFSPTVTTLHTNLGYTVYVRYKILRKQQTGVLNKTLDIHNNYCTQYATNHAQLDYQPVEKNYVNSRQQWQVLEHDVCHTGPSLPLNHHSWVPTTLQAIGKFMYHIIMHDLKVNVNSMRSNKKNTNYLPAFYTIFRCQNRMVKEEVKPHPILSRLYRASESETLTFPTYELPMVCPPVPWVSTHFGGYLVSPCEVIRLPSCAFVQKQRLSETNPVKLYPSLDALNQLAAVPWKVNQNILDVILEVFQKGGSAKLDVPEHPSTLAPPKGFSDNMDKTEKYQVFKQKLQYKRKKDEMYSMWCDCLYRLSLANHFRNDTFWLPHNMDFRGRVYPIPPHLNHLGSDLARSILIFAEPRPLGPDGLDWLKIHLVNLTGLKKRDPVSERLKFANEIMDRILDSADNPLTGKRWWASSDEPWQTLACCMEIANVIRSGDTVNYRSHFPIHQDGSCNGLQHYAALGRDSAGAFSVNLAPSDVPQDVYSAVVQLVEQQRAKDAADGHEIAKVLEGFVVRKVIKQTIMTTVYGVTRYGARLQIARQLKDIDAFPKESVWAASSYLTARTFDSLRTMFTSTKEIQDWFTECARLISSVSAKHVEWVTPLGLPIVQPYYKTKKVNTPAYGTFAVDQFGVPNVMKQKNAFPPNFIHSLDSSHMMLTSLHCEREGLTFVSVHDCYWTHPATVAIMNTICREQFVALHSEPILEDLSVYLMDKFRFNDGDISGDGSVMDLTKKKLNRRLQMLPRKGDFDVKNVLNSTYFFS